MRELIEITSAFDALVAQGKSAALATVIAIEGSAYRRPGARMLIAENGQTWGGVSGGCLERDVARRGREVMNSLTPQRKRYDSTDDDANDNRTGCDGAIEIFIQPLTGDVRGPMNFLQEVLVSRRAISIGTILRSDMREVTAGDVFPMTKFDAWQECKSPVANREIAPVWVDSSYGTIEQRCSGAQVVELFVERILPPQSLVIVGSGPDARAVAVLAKSLGWHVTIVAARPALFIHERFAGVADRIEISGADAPLENVSIALDSAVVLMTHNVARDRLALAALPRGVAYLGMLGPRHRTDQILATLGEHHRASLASPVGLDIGAETPEEIALAIVAEIQASLRGATGLSLSKIGGPIHAATRPPTAITQSNSNRVTACPT